MRACASPTVSSRASSSHSARKFSILPSSYLRKTLHFHTVGSRGRAQSGPSLTQVLGGERLQCSKDVSIESEARVQNYEFAAFMAHSNILMTRKRKTSAEFGSGGQAHEHKLLKARRQCLAELHSGFSCGERVIKKRSNYMTFGRCEAREKRIIAEPAARWSACTNTALSPGRRVRIGQYHPVT